MTERVKSNSALNLMIDISSNQISLSTSFVPSIMNLPVVTPDGFTYERFITGRRPATNGMVPNWGPTGVIDDSNSFPIDSEEEGSKIRCGGSLTEGRVASEVSDSDRRRSSRYASVPDQDIGGEAGTPVATTPAGPHAAVEDDQDGMLSEFRRQTKVVFTIGIFAVFGTATYVAYLSFGFPCLFACI